MSLDNFMKKFLSFFSYKKEELTKQILLDGEVLYTCLIEEIFMPEVIKLLETESDKEKLVSLFGFFEMVSTCNNQELINSYFSVTVLEILGNDKKILGIAKKYMGPATTKLQREADLALGRDVD